MGHGMKRIEEGAEHDYTGEGDDEAESSPNANPSGAATPARSRGRSSANSSAATSMEIRKERGESAGGKEAGGGGTPGAGVRASVVASARDSEEAQHWLVFEVSDTGVGIPPGGLRKLFKAFVQGSPVRAVVSSGRSPAQRSPWLLRSTTRLLSDPLGWLRSTPLASRSLAACCHSRSPSPCHGSVTL